MLSKRYLYTLLMMILFLAAIPLICIAENPVKFAVISDHLGRLNELDKTLTFLESQNVDILFVAGDFLGQSYYDHYLDHNFYSNPVVNAEHKQVVFVMGNHDKPPFGDTIFQTQIAPFYSINGPGDAPEGTVFSFNSGDCHFVITNQYWSAPRGSYSDEQLEWINADLAESTQSFKFVFGHEPAFPLRRHVGDSLDFDPDMRDRFWDILLAQGAQAFFCGHTHNLSSIQSKGVYQFDAGEIRDDNHGITIVDVGHDTAFVHMSYLENTQAPYTTTLVYEVQLYSNYVDASELAITDSVAIDFIGARGPADSSSCFISTISH